MVIDIHTHVPFYKVYPPKFLELMTRELMASVSNVKSKFAKTAPLQILNGFLNDRDGSMMIRQLDDAGIDQAVVLIIDAGICLGEAELSLREIFDHHRRLLQNFPDRLKIFAGIDPRRGADGLELFKKSIDHGFSGLKLYPSMGYRLWDEALYPYYELCSGNHMPVLTHTGPSLDVLANELAEPEEIKKAAKDFPNVKFILAHAGQRITESRIQELVSIPNVYLDISAFQMGYRKAADMKEDMGAIFSSRFYKKILFGTDYPLFNLFTPLSSNIGLLTELWKIVEEKESDSLSAVLGGNAMELLNHGRNHHVNSTQLV